MRAAEFFNQWQPHLSVGLEFFCFEGSDLIAEVAGYHSQSPHDGPIGRLPSQHTVSSQTRTFLGRRQQPCRRPLRVKADLTAQKSDFRFTPESRLKSDITPCPKSANNGLMHPSDPLTWARQLSHCRRKKVPARRTCQSEDHICSASRAPRWSEWV